MDLVANLCKFDLHARSSLNEIVSFTFGMPLGLGSMRPENILLLKLAFVIMLLLNNNNNNNNYNNNNYNNNSNNSSNV